MFDPYHKWLGIAPKDQPPNHYRLLAIDLFESDPEVIDAGANRQMAYLQQRATGEHAAFSQKILNEIAAARLCLLNPKQKSQYDAELNVKLAEKSQTLERPSPDLSEIASSPIADVLPTPTFPRLVRPARTRRSFQPKLWHYAVVIGVVGLFGIGGWAIFTSGHTSKQQVAISESEQAAVPQGKEAAAFSSGTPAAASPSQIGETKAMATSPPPPSPVKTDASASSPSGEGKEGWTDLFDGRTLEGWSVVFLNYSKSRINTSWRADPERGVLVSTGGDFNELRTDRKFKNFTLTLEWRFTPGGFVGVNGSGIIVRSNGLGPKDNDPQGIEIDLRPEKNEAQQMGTGCFITYGTTLRNHRGIATGKYGENRHLGWLREPGLGPDGRWNECEIVCKEDRITVKMNGQLVNEGWEAEVVEGSICLRNQNTAIEFRNLRLVPSPILSDQTNSPTNAEIDEAKEKADEGHGMTLGEEPESQDTLPQASEGKTWKLIWHDEFDGTTLDDSKWSVMPNDRRKDGWWTPKAVSLDGKGHLVIKTLREGGKYLDGCVHTNGKFEHSFGYYVARVRMQRQPGHWSCFWVFGDGVKKVGTNGRDGSEIDIVTKAWLDDRVQHSLHWDGYGSEHKMEAQVVHVPGVMEGFHTFGVWWKEDEYIFYVDGRETWRRSGGAVCRVPQYLQLSDEMGPWAGDIKKADLPDQFLVDYVRVYDLVANE